MADAPTSFSTISSDAPNVYIAAETLRLVERNLRVGKYASRYSLEQRTGKTLRVVRYRRMALPLTTLTEGTAPDAVALAVDTVDVTVEQWGIVALLTDVAQITTKHPALQIAIDRTGLAMSELLEREMCNMLLGGTNVVYPAAITARGSLAATDILATATVLKATASLRARGGAEFEGALFGGAMAPQQEADVLAADQTFKDASNFANVRALQFGEIGIWMGVRWARGNFLPVFQGVAAVTTAAATAEKTQITATDGGGTITSSTNFKFCVVARDINTDYELKISVVSANIASAATGNTESFTFVMPSSTNYTYDIYMSAAGGSGSLFKVKSRQTAGATVVQTAEPAGTEATAPVAPAVDVSVFVAWVFAKDAFGRVELNGMSLQSYITPAGASYSNPLAQGRKVGSKVMWKSFILDNAFFTRIETSSAYADELPV